MSMSMQQDETKCICNCDCSGRQCLPPSQRQTPRGRHGLLMQSYTAYESRLATMQALIHGLNRHYYSIAISYRKNELEERMLMNLQKKTWTHGLQLRCGIESVTADWSCSLWKKKGRSTLCGFFFRIRKKYQICDDV